MLVIILFCYSTVFLTFTITIHRQVEWTAVGFLFFKIPFSLPDSNTWYLLFRCKCDLPNICSTLDLVNTSLLTPDLLYSYILVSMSNAFMDESNSGNICSTVKLEERNRLVTNLHFVVHRKHFAYQVKSVLDVLPRGYSELGKIQKETLPWSIFISPTWLDQHFQQSCFLPCCDVPSFPFGNCKNVLRSASINDCNWTTDSRQKSKTLKWKFESVAFCATGLFQFVVAMCV